MADIYSVLITGASRGIGLEFVRQFLTSPLLRTQIVIAACRSPEQATALQELKKNHQQLYIIKLNVLEFDTYDKIANEVQNIVGEKGLTLLINNAGIGPGRDTLDEVTVDEFLTVLKTNAIAPVMLTKALRPLIRKSAQVQKAKTSGLSVTRAAVININSFNGSIKLNTTGRRWCYRESKAAQNMSTQTLSFELLEDGILVDAIHPGHVLTDMGGPSGKVDVTTSVTGMINVMLKMTENNKNGYYTWEGEVFPF